MEGNNGKEFSHLTNFTVNTIPASPLSMVEFRSTSSEYLQPSILSIVKSAPNRFFPTRPTYVIYATVQPETVVIPIVCSIILFPTLVLAGILLLKHYNEKRRAKDRFRAGFQYGASTLFTMGKIGATSKVAEKVEDIDKSTGLQTIGNYFGLTDIELDITDHNESLSSLSCINGGQTKGSIHIIPISNQPKVKLKLPNNSGHDNGPDRQGNKDKRKQSCEIVVTIESEIDLCKKSSDEKKEIVVILENDEAELMETAL